MAKDFYSVLDIPSSTSKEEIRQAYLRIARECHPDVSKDPRARERFEEVHQAYVILSDYEARRYYNLYREGGMEKAAQDESSYTPPLPRLWWQKLAVVAIFGMVLLGILGILALGGLILYLPHFL
jgi:DnaJ-class molecular chaperone